MLKRKLKVSIVIVDYFKADRVLTNVENALSQSGDYEIEIIIIDNSCDGDNQRILSALNGVENVSVIVNLHNEGYVKSCNAGVALSQGDFVFLVNPDIIWVTDDIITKVIRKFYADPEIGIIGTRQVNDDGRIAETVRRFPGFFAQIARRTFLRNLPLVKKYVANYEFSDFDYLVSSDVDWIQSSFMVIKRDVWTLLDGLDSRFFLFMSDPDICYRAWLKNIRVHYMADVLVGADGKRCSAGGFSTIFTSKTLRYHLRDAVYYYLKYFFR